MTMTRRQFLERVAGTVGVVALARTFPAAPPSWPTAGAMTRRLVSTPDRRALLMAYGVSVDGIGTVPLQFDVLERAVDPRDPPLVIGRHHIYESAHVTLGGGRPVDLSRLQFVLRDDVGGTVVHGAHYSFQILV